jgi:hypothetical protein
MNSKSPSSTRSSGRASWPQSTSAAVGIISPLNVPVARNENHKGSEYRYVLLEHGGYITSCRPPLWQHGARVHRASTTFVVIVELNVDVCRGR